MRAFSVLIVCVVAIIVLVVSQLLDKSYCYSKLDQIGLDGSWSFAYGCVAFKSDELVQLSDYLVFD